MKLACLLFFLTVTIYSQGLTTDVRNNENVYLFALTEYCNSPEIVKSSQVFVQFDSTVMWYDWPKSINGKEIIYLDGNDEIIDKIKRNSGSLILVRIIPIQYKNEKFFVNVIPFLATTKKKNLKLSNGGGLAVIFDFKENLKGFTFSNNKWNSL